MSISRELKRYGSYTVSTATLREEDVGRNFLDAMEEVEVPTARINYLENEFSETLKRDDDHAMEDLGYIVWEEMFDTLAEHAPDGFYFGNLEGDGSEFGYWPETEEG